MDTDGQRHRHLRSSLDVGKRAAEMESRQGKWQGLKWKHAGILMHDVYDLRNYKMGSIFQDEQMGVNVSLRPIE